MRVTPPASWLMTPRAAHALISDHASAHPASVCLRLASLHAQRRFVCVPIHTWSACPVTCCFCVAARSILWQSVTSRCNSYSNALLPLPWSPIRTIGSSTSPPLALHTDTARCASHPCPRPPPICEHCQRPQITLRALARARPRTPASPLSLNPRLACRVGMRELKWRAATSQAVLVSPSRKHLALSQSPAAFNPMCLQASSSSDDGWLSPPMSPPYSPAALCSSLLRFSRETKGACMASCRAWLLCRSRSWSPSP